MIKHGYPVSRRIPVQEALPIVYRRTVESQIPSDATKLRFEMAYQRIPHV
jgi:hypothetical protein